MIDEKIDADFESLLKETLAEMIPKSHAVACASSGTRPTFDDGRSVLIPDLSQRSPNRSGDRRRVAVGAAGLAALTVGGLVLMSGRENNTTAPAASSASIDEVVAPVAVSPDAPAWYASISSAVPERFRHIALTRVSDRDLAFVAVSPEDGKSLEILLSASEPIESYPVDYWVESTQGWTVHTLSGLSVSVTCDIGAPGRDLTGLPPFCDMSPGEFTKNEIRLVATKLAESTSVAMINAPLGSPVVATVDHSSALTSLMATIKPDQVLVGDMVWGPADRLLNYGNALGPPALTVRLVSGLYPPPANPISPFALYDDAAVFWRFSPDGTAVRITTTDPSPESLLALGTITASVLDQPGAPSAATALVGCAAGAVQAVVPNVLTMSFDEATAELEGSGFIAQGLFELTPVGNAAGQDPVIGQSVPPDAVANCGSTIELTVPYQPGPLYAIQSGDSYASIATTLSLSVEDLLAFNGLTEAEISVGGQTIDSPLQIGRALRTTPFVAHDG